MSLTQYRGAHLARHGVVGVVLVVCVIAIGLQSQKFLAWASTVRYTAIFAEAGGLSVGDEVVLSGVTVGSVARLSLDNGDAKVEFNVRDRVVLGGGTSVHIKTGSLLGKRVLTLVSAGPDVLRPGDIVPIERTSSPYSLTDAVGELAANVGETDTAALDASLDTLAVTLDRIAPRLGPTFDGLTALSRSINSRDETLRALLTATADVTGILADRGAQLNTMILDSNALLQTLVARRQAIVDLLAGTAAVAEQLRGLVADNEADLAPTLDRLNSVVAMLEKNRDNIAAALPGLAKVSMTQGEAVSGGPFYNAFVANLIPGDLIQPFIDQAFGVQQPVPTPEPPR